MREPFRPSSSSSMAGHFPSWALSVPPDWMLCRTARARSGQAVATMCGTEYIHTVLYMHSTGLYMERPRHGPFGMYMLVLDLSKGVCTSAKARASYSCC